MASAGAGGSGSDSAVVGDGRKMRKMRLQAEDLGYGSLGTRCNGLSG